MMKDNPRLLLQEAKFYELLHHWHLLL